MGFTGGVSGSNEVRGGGEVVYVDMLPYLICKCTYYIPGKCKFDLGY